MKFTRGDYDLLDSYMFAVRQKVKQKCPSHTSRLNTPSYDCTIHTPVATDVVRVVFSYWTIICIKYAVSIEHSYAAIAMIHQSRVLMSIDVGILNRNASRHKKHDHKHGYDNVYSR